MRAPVSRSSRRGGALILALLFIGVVTAGFVSWVTLIRQRARVADLEEHQARKRLSAANSEVLARDYLLRRVIAANYDDTLNSTTDGGGWSGTLTDSWNGGSQIRFASATIGPPNWDGFFSGYPLDSPDKPGGLNAFSPTFDYPYSKTLEFGTDYKQLQFIDDPAQRASLTNSPERYRSDATAYRGYVRSRNLLLGGDLLVLHKPTVTTVMPAVAGNVAVQGRVVHFAPEITATTAYPTIYSARSQRFTAPGQNTLNVVPANIAGAALLVSNLAWTPLTVGNVGSGDSANTDSYDWRIPNFDGQLNFIDPPTNDTGTVKQNASNSLKAELVGAIPPAATGASFDDSRGLNISSGIATITPTKGPLADDVPSVVLKNNGAANSNNLTSIVIEGQSVSNILNSYAEYRSAMVIVFTQASTGANLTKITLRHQNKRKLLLAIKKDHRTTASWDPTVTITLESNVADSEWHLLVLSENVPIKFEYSNTAPYIASTLRLYGGIETNAPLTFPPSPKLCEINLETDPRGLIKFAPRLAWVETFLNGKL